MSGAGKPWAVHLGKTMKLMREMKKMSLRKHASDLKLSPATLSRIENGAGCDMETLINVSTKTGVKVSTLLGLD